ncbi:sulfate ABC transporter substrate-binding protein [Brackiella oedipodis]|uniref:sulfate ABC transporter substrate-binding protein n=1 Tax=Brackiella oedipodis TaxID=124225 RepID=UPI00048BA3E8|nr:sulfate ABC transporter substrate-binding protein [Brackiella oedipodis]
MRLSKLLLSLGLSLGMMASVNAQDSHQHRILNASYDVTRDFFRQYNPLFSKHYAQAHEGETVTIEQSHGGSSKQALSVANGLQADVVTMNQSSDINLLVEKGLIDKDWHQKLPNQALAFTSPTVILVRKGNPKGIHDWPDLIKDDVKVLFANPKSSGNGRYAFLAIYGAALKRFDNDSHKAQEFASEVLKRIPVRDGGGRGATSSFIQRHIGDALIAPENEAQMAAQQFGKNQFELIYPSYTIETEIPVAVVDAVAAKKGNSDVAKEYLRYLWSEPGQNLGAKLYYRPSVEQVRLQYKDRFPEVKTFKAGEVFGSWPDIMSKIFGDGGVFDQIDARNAQH